MSACEARIDSSPGSRLPGGGEDDRTDDVVAVRAEIGEGGAQVGGRALLGHPRETVEQGLGLRQRQLLRGVIRLLRFGVVRHLDAAAVEDLRRGRGAAHRDQRGPAGMGAQSQRGLRTTRRHALPSFKAAWPIMPCVTSAG